MSCLRPMTKKDGTVFPCGKCPPCINRLTSGWAFRLLQEERNSISSHFITFTYDTPNLVTTPHGLRSLCKYHLQCFFKRLRKHNSGKKIKYYAVGEYGSQTKRPHYHAIIFNADVNTIELAWTQRENKHEKPISIGEIYYGDVSGHSIGYTLKYICKGKTVPAFDKDDRQREFSIMSKGLGISYLTDNMLMWHNADLLNRQYVNLKGDIKIAMPRYYREKIYVTEYQKELIRIGGSLITQHDFLEQIKEGLTQRDFGTKLYSQRVDAAFRRHNIKKHEKLLL
ncbi:MAG: replication initiator protein [Microvirus sp.]|nr:MAG: replication initiator protein [Microvirus sp.]